MPIKSIIDIIFSEFNIIVVGFAILLYTIYKVNENSKKSFVTIEKYKEDRKLDKEKREGFANSFKDELIRMEKMQNYNYSDLKEDIKGLAELFQKTTKDLEDKIFELYKSRSEKK